MKYTVVQPNAISANGSVSGDQLLGALWRSHNRAHLLGAMDRRTNQFTNIPVCSIGEAAGRAQSLCAAGLDVYFACAEFQSSYSRVAANVSCVWGFWIDLDVGQEKHAAGKGYLTEDNAFVAVVQFCSDTELPHPTHIVSSGGGLHVYWLLDCELLPEQWREYAKKLKRLTKSFGLLADDSRTADIASVLRVPGTLNYKYAPPRNVSLILASDGAIAQSSMLDAIDLAYNSVCPITAIRTPSPITRIGGSEDTSPEKYKRPDLVGLASALSVLDPDCDEETWKLKRLAPMAHAAREHPECGQALYELARSWSSGELRGKASKAWTNPGNNGRTGEGVFDAVWDRFLRTGYAGIPTTLGTIFFDAMAAGWERIDPADEFEIINDGNGEAK